MAMRDTVRFSRDLSSDEQPYERRTVVGESWTAVDCGWIDRCGMLMLRNEEGHFSVNPTPEQRAEVMRRVVEITFGTVLTTGVPSRECLLIPPKETCRFYPSDVKSLHLRCRAGKAQITLYLLPE
jgi:hypothetical protein